MDLTSNALREDGKGSADAAGLPILPGLVRYDEVAAGEIRHALRFTAPQTQRAYTWPARHFASPHTEPDFPPMGAAVPAEGGCRYQQIFEVEPGDPDGAETLWDDAKR